MRRSSGLTLTLIGALVFAWGLFAPAPSLGQEAGGSEGSSSAAESTDAPGQEEDGGGTPVPAAQAAEKEHGRGARRPLLPGSTPPPTDLKFVGDHWTPYDPPAPESFAPDATLHIIVPGDTLWDLADLAFGDPYLWPQIWNQNRYILDSHWIYPGDPLLLPPRPTVVTRVVPRGQRGAPPMPEAEPPPAPGPRPIQGPLASAPPAPPQEAPDLPRAPEQAHAPRAVPKLDQLADEVDLRCSGFIARRDTVPDYFIANQMEESKVSLTQGDIIYLNRGRSNGHVDPGTEYSIVAREGVIRHPLTHKKLGFYYKRLGTVRVLAAQERTAIGKISMACDEIRTGYDLVALRVEPIPSGPVPPFDRLQVLQEGKATGYIVHTMDNVAVVGTGYIVDIDLGYDDGLKAGDFLTIFVPNEPYDLYRRLHYEYEWSGLSMRPPKQRRDRKNVYPPKVIGQMVVLTTEKNTSTAKIIHAVREIEVGNMVEAY
ncbi:MAG: LysM peptidoglycan-binding domain-containing protein [Acidobacteriota bacterium]